MKPFRLICGLPARALVVFIFGLSAVLAAQTREIDFDIPATDAISAIPEFARQAGLQIVAPADRLKGVKTLALKGTYDIRKALKQLLIGTGLEISSDDGTTITLQYAANERTSRADRGLDPDRALDEVVVTGSRIALAPGRETAQPVKAYSRVDMQRSGQTTIADFLNTLPSVSTSNVEGDSQSFLGRTTVQLHGLPAGTTLTLLNGRRIEGGYYGYFDLGSVPAAAIERIEVLPVGSSAVYGSDALAGAVNLVLRKDIEGFEVNAKYGGANRTGEDDFSVAAGRKWERGSISIIASFQGRTNLLTNDRRITSTASIPSGAPDFETTDSCSPGTVYSLNGQGLPGLGNATQAAIPRGISGKPTIASFQAAAGTVNTCNFYLDTALIPQTRREGALISAHYAFNENADVFAEVLVSNEFQRNLVGDAVTLQGGSSAETTIGAGNPYNPFGEDVGVSYAYRGLLSSYDNWQTFFRPLIGVRGSLSHGWDYEITGVFSQDHAHDASSYTDQTSLQSALNATDPEFAFNPFASGAPGSPQLLRSLLDTVADSFRNQLISTQAVLRGTLLTLPAGPLKAVFGAQFDHEREITTFSENQPDASSIDLSRNTYAIFTEERLPLIANAVHPAAGETVALSLAGRYDHSNDFGGKATGQAGLEWRPRDSLLFRAAYATSYKAPQLTQIVGGITSPYSEEIVDTLRAGQSYTTTIQPGANPGLKPETGRSQVYGMVYDSAALQGFKISMNYFSIQIGNYIAQLDPQVLIQNPGLFPRAIDRAAPTAADTAQGFPGVITQIQDLYYNYGDIRASGVDFDVNYRLTTDIGVFTPSIAVTDMVRYRSSLTPASPSVSYLSQATLYGPGFAPRWKGTVSANLESGPLSTNVTGRYVGKYTDYQDYVANSNELGNTWYCDVNLHYDVGKALGITDRWYSKGYAELGAVNLFDKLPKFSDNGYGYDYAESDIRGRFVYLQFGIKL